MGLALTHALGGLTRPLGGPRNQITMRSIFRTRTGIWYDPQDLTTMYQDAAGTLPVYRPGTGLVDPPVGLMLDKSQGLELGPELVVNGDSSLDMSGWSAENASVSTEGDGFAVTATSAFGSIRQSTEQTGLKTWMVSFDILSTTEVNVGAINVYDYSGTIINATVTPRFNEGHHILYLTSNGISSVRMRVATSGHTVNYSNISIREIKGYHAYQPTTTARPTLSGRYNLLTATETLSTQSVTTVAATYTLRFSGTGTITLSGTAIGVKSAGTHTITCTAGTLTCTVAGAVTRADLRVKRDGSSLPAYQSVTDANTYDTAGFPLFLKRDKVDDVLTCVAPAITGYQGMGSTGGAVLGPVIIPAGTYTPLSESATTGIPEITRYVAIDGALTASEQAVVERYLSVPSSGVLAKTPVFSFGLTSVASFSFALRTKADTAPVLIEWGDGTQSTHAGTTDQTASHTYAVRGTYAVKVYGADESVLTKFSTGVGGMSGALILPSGMTYFICAGSNTLSGTLSLPSNMTYFSCHGSNTLSGTLSLPAGMMYFDCRGSNTLTGTLSMPSGMTYFICQGSNTLTGTLSMPSGMTYFGCSGSNTLTGTLSLPSDMTYFGCSGSNTLTGTLSLPSDMTYFICSGSNTLSGYTPSAKASNQQRFFITGLNTMSAADVDNILIDYDAAGGTWVSPKEITIQGNAANRTSASDAAYASLASKLTTLSVD